MPQKKNIRTLIEKEVRTLLSKDKTSHDWEHTNRVLNMALHIGKKEKANLEILELAALLHDIGRPEEHKSKGKLDHAEIGAQKAEKILKRHGVDLKKIEKIVHCIRCHRFRGKNIPKSLEAKVFFDADKLDSSGAIGIGRAFFWASQVGAKLHNDKGCDIKKTKEYSQEDTAYREFIVKLRHIRDRMLTHEGKRIAEHRHRFMIYFFKELEKETEGEK